MSKPEITLFTSIPPRMSRPIQGRDLGPAWQAACIESWKDAGFRVVSLNAPKEIKALRSTAPAVEFRKIPKGHARPRLTDFFSAAKSFGSKIAGIINADCMIVPQAGVVKHLTDHLDGIVIAERINLSQKTLLSTGKSCHGFDAFFFEVSALAEIESDDHWCIGEVWNDFWLPLAFQAAGFDIQTLPAPILLHLDHDQAWDWSAWEGNFSRLIDFLRCHEGGRIDQTLATELMKEKKLHTADVLELSYQLFVWLRSRGPLWRPLAGSAEDLMAHFLNAQMEVRRAGRYRVLLRRIMDTLGLRRMFHALGMVRGRIPS